MNSDTTRTGPLVGQLVEGVQADIGDALEQIGTGLDMLRKLESHARGINGLQGTLKAECSKLDQIVTTLAAESEAVARKLLGTGREPIVERVDIEHAAKVVAAKEGAA